MNSHTTAHVSQLEDALLKAFSLNSLKRMARRRFGITLENEINLAQGLKYIISELIEVSIREGWSEQLVRGAIHENDHPLLVKFAEDNRIVIHPEQVPGGPLPKSVDQGALEKIVRERGDFIKWQDFVNRLTALGRQLCRIEIGEVAVGTGWLVAPDMILTNYHVLETVKNGATASADLSCRFDYSGRVQTNDVTCPLAASWEIATSKSALSDVEVNSAEATDNELDYAVVRLDRAIGNELLKDPSSKRGWVRISASPPIVQENDILIVPQHPDGRTLELAFGQALGFNTLGTRLRHNANTERGSSGSPCLTTTLLPFALHHASGPGRIMRYNQCVPIRKIIQHLSKKGITPFWES